MFPRKLYPGQQLTASELNDLQRAVHRQANASGTGSNTVADNPSGRIVRDNSPESIYGRISGAPTGSVYPWVEVAYDGSAWDDLTVWPGRSGTAASGGAKELTGNTGVATNTIVQLTPLPGGGGWGFYSPVASSGTSLTTGNVGDSGAEDSTTTVLRFNEATKIKVTKGATAGDPDIVTITGNSYTTSGLTILGTTVSGVVTATRTLPALPRAWARFNTVGGTLTAGAQGGELGAPTITRVAKGWFQVTWSGVSSNAAVSVTAIGETTNAVEVGAVMSVLGVVDVFVTSGGSADDVTDCSVIVVY